MKLKRIEVQLKLAGGCIVYENAMDYEKGSFYCVRFTGEDNVSGGTVRKYPVSDIFSITATYVLTDHGESR